MRRAKLYYLRELRGKKAKIKEKREKQPSADPAVRLASLAARGRHYVCASDRMRQRASTARSRWYGDARYRPTASSRRLGGSAAARRPTGARADGSVDRCEASSRPARRRRGAGAGARQMPLWQELPLLLVVAFCLAVLIRTFLLQAFFIPSGSMEHTLLVGDRVLVNKVVYDVRDPQRGEVVVFRGTDDVGAARTGRRRQPGFVAKLGRTVGDLVGVSQPGEKDFIKRVIGLPGDTVACCDAQGRVTVNGSALDEPYVPRRTRRWTRRRRPGSAGRGGSPR